MPCSGRSPAGWQFTQRGCWITFPASSKSATERALASAMDSNSEAGRSARLLLCARRGGEGDRREQDASGKRYSSKKPSHERLPDDGAAWKGSWRTGWPVSFRQALATAGPIGGTPGSPTPVGASVDGMTATSIVRHLVDAQHAIVVEIRLLNVPALAERDLAEQDGAEAEADAALHLRADDVRVDRHAAIDRAPDLVHAR